MTVARFKRLILGTGLTGVDNGDDTITINASGGGGDLIWEDVGTGTLPAGVTYVNKQESTRTGSTAAFSPALPTGYTVGNLLVMCCISWGTSNPTVTTPAGWTQIIGGGTLFLSAHGRIYVWVKQAVASEPTPSLLPSASSYFHVVILEYSGQNATPTDGTAATGTAAAGTTVNTPAITTSFANSLVLYVYGDGENDPANVTPPAGTTIRNRTAFSALGTDLVVSEIRQATAGTVAATSHTRVAVTTTALANTLALRAA